MVSMAEVFGSLVVLALIVLVGQILREHVRLFRRLLLPGSIIAGFLALILGPQVLGWTAGFFTEEGAAIRQGVFPEFMIDTWSSLPGLLINIVFAALFLGKPIPPVREIWLKAGPQVVFGQTVAWGQYVVGLGLAIIVLAPLFGTNPMAGALIEIGFEGGHGTSAGMRETMEQHGFPEGADIALGLATVGIVGGVLLGTALVNWAAWRGEITITEDGQIVPPDVAQETGGQTVELSKTDVKEAKKQKWLEISATDPLSLHFAIVAMAIVIGWVILESLRWFEGLFWDGALFDGMPLFPMAMIGGVMIQIFIDRTRLARHISRPLMSRISGTALDYTIVAALATLSLTAIAEHLWPFLLLAVTGIAWCLFALIVIAPRVIPYDWFERGVGDFGQSMGVTVTGLLLMRMADPENRSGCFESFGYKQLLFEPIVGGGLFTGASIALIYQFGPVNILTLCAVITAGWLIFGFLYFGPMVRAERAKRRG